MGRYFHSAFSIFAAIFCVGLAPSSLRADADLRISVQVSAQTVHVGDTIHYTGTATNFGPGSATNINGGFGPDNSDSVPNPSTDKYTAFGFSDPAPFFYRLD